MFRALLNLALPILMLAAVVSVLRRKRRGENLGNVGFRPVSPGGNPVFAPIHFGGGEAKVEQVEEAWRGGAAPPVPGMDLPSPPDLPTARGPADFPRGYSERTLGHR